MSSLLVIFVLAIFLGFSVVYRVTPALHSPLMSLTNAVSSVIVLGALAAMNIPVEGLGPVALVVLAALFCCSINIVGGFWMTHRMLSMFRRSQKGGQ